MNALKLLLFFVLFFLLTQHSYSQDWASLKRYEKENAAIKHSESNNDRVVFMGNSITEGWINMHPEFFSGRQYINRGISGQTTPQMLIRFRQDVINLKPSVVVIFADINDIAGNTGLSTIEMISDNIFSMVDIAEANDVNVVLCSILPAFDFPWWPGLKPAGKVVQLNNQLKAYSKVNEIVFVDYFFAMFNDKNGLKKELGSDGVHPNEIGYSIMEPLVETGISKALNQRK